MKRSWKIIPAHIFRDRLMTDRNGGVFPTPQKLTARGHPMSLQVAKVLYQFPFFICGAACIAQRTSTMILARGFTPSHTILRGCRKQR